MATKTKPRTHDSFEVYMKLKDRRRLATLIEIQEVSKRAVARAAGYDSHTYILRLLNGQATTCSPEAAVRLAKFFGVPVEHLFLTKVDTSSDRSGRAA